MENAYLLRDSKADLALLSLINRGYYRTIWQVHLNVQEGKDVDHGISRDYVSGELAREVITPMLLEAGVFERSQDGRLTTQYHDLIIDDPKRLRNSLIASMEHNIRDMCRYAVTLSDDENSRGTGYTFKRGCDTVVSEGIDEIRQGFRKVLNAPLNEDDTKNVVVEIAVVSLKEINNNA